MRPTAARELEYALRALVLLATVDERTRAADIARSCGIPPGTLRHVLDTLQRGTLVSAQPSRNGGYTLSRAASLITVLEVIEALEGPLEVSDCVFGLGKCVHVDRCALHATWESAWQAMSGRLACSTIADLVAHDAGQGPPVTSAPRTREPNGEA